ncbi:MAG: MerR family transcriptional regulator [Sebaldella sp.]|nr:MerR family transcriptional regulator [Sebaldella sp.]
MKTFSLATVAKIIGISKSTLRYYDKLDLLIPKRADNQYRFYNEQDLIYLKYIQVLKHNGCSLTEIRELLSLYELEINDHCIEILNSFISNKRQKVNKEIKQLELTLNFLDEAEKFIGTRTNSMDLLISEIFETIKDGDD